MRFQMLEVIFTDRFRAILSRGDKNILSLLSCGSLSSYPDSRIEIQKFANTCVANYINNKCLMLISPGTFSKKFFALRKQTSSPPLPTNSSWIGPFPILSMNAEAFPLSLWIIKHWVLIPILFSFDLRQQQHSDGHTQVSALLESLGSLSNAPMVNATDWKR